MQSINATTNFVFVTIGSCTLETRRIELGIFVMIIQRFSFLLSVDPRLFGDFLETNWRHLGDFLESYWRILKVLWELFRVNLENSWSWTAEVLEFSENISSSSTNFSLKISWNLPQTSQGRSEDFKILQNVWLQNDCRILEVLQKLFVVNLREV